MVANRLAASGEDWVRIQLKYNSGTCNNQWIVVDQNRMREIQVQDGIEDLDEDVVYWLHVGYLLKQLEGLKPPCFESITLSLLKP